LAQAGFENAYQRSELDDDGYAIFDSAHYGRLQPKWLFPQEEAALHGFTIARCESKML